MIDREMIDRYKGYLEFKELKLDNGILVVEVSAFSTILWGGEGRCDNCGKVQEHGHKGYYIPVLNRWFCKDCFDGYKLRSKHYPEDDRIELLNHEGHLAMLKAMQTITIVELVDIIRDLAE